MYSRTNAYRRRDLDDRRVRQDRFTSSRRTRRIDTLSFPDYPKLPTLGALLVLPIFGAVHAWLNEVEHCRFLLMYPLMSVLSVYRYQQDKRQAVHHRWRTSEEELHVLALLGGWPGAMVAQHLFRHKIYKCEFQLCFLVIVAMHQYFWWNYSRDLLLPYLHEISEKTIDFFKIIKSIFLS